MAIEYGLSSPSDKNWRSFTALPIDFIVLKDEHGEEMYRSHPGKIDNDSQEYFRRVEPFTGTHSSGVDFCVTQLGDEDCGLFDYLLGHTDGFIEIHAKDFILFSRCVCTGLPFDLGDMTAKTSFVFNDSPVIKGEKQCLI